MTAIINTDGMEPLEWFDYTTDNFAAVFPPFTMTDLAQWREWGANARRVVPSVPDPYQYADWKEWADRFNLVMVQRQ